MNKFIHLVILFKEKNHFSTSCYEAKLTRKMLVTKVNGSAACICLLCRGTSQTPRNTFKKKNQNHHHHIIGMPKGNFMFKSCKDI